MASLYEQESSDSEDEQLQPQDQDLLAQQQKPLVDSDSEDEVLALPGGIGGVKADAEVTEDNGGLAAMDVDGDGGAEESKASVDPPSAEAAPAHAAAETPVAAAAAAAEDEARESAAAGDSDAAAVPDVNGEAATPAAGDATAVTAVTDDSMAVTDNATAVADDAAAVAEGAPAAAADDAMAVTDDVTDVTGIVPTAPAEEAVAAQAAAQLAALERSASAAAARPALEREQSTKRMRKAKPKVQRGPWFDVALVGASSNASDRSKLALMAIEMDRWDVDAWISLITEAQGGRSGGLTLREVYKQLLHPSQFPTSGKYWKLLAELELEAGDSKAVDEALGKSLIQCANLDLWLFYLEKMKRSALGKSTENSGENAGGAGENSADAQAEMSAAYELALRHMGTDLWSAPLWNDYIAFIKSWPERHGLDTGNKVLALRRVYQRALGVPMENLDKLWKDYEAFETSRSEHLAKAKFIPENIHRFQASRAVYKERKQMWDGCDLSMLATPPMVPHSIGGMRQMRQLRLWKRRIDYEKTNPERVNDVALSERVLHAFRQCLCCLRHFPEIWQEWAQWEARTPEGHERAAKVYQQAVEVLPGCELLRIAKAELEEARGHIKEAKAAWTEYKEAFPESTLRHIMFQKFLRRVDGKEAARAFFGTSLPLRKAGRLGFQVYTAHAAMELHVNGEPEVAQRVLEYGLGRHGSFIAEPEYILAYVDVLLHMRDEANLRVLLERVLSPAALPPERAPLVWDRFVELELWRTATGGNMAKAEAIEERRARFYPRHPTSHGLGRTWHRCALSGLLPSVLASQDKAFLERCGIIHIDMPPPMAPPPAPPAAPPAPAPAGAGGGAEEKSAEEAGAPAKKLKRKRWESADKAADRIRSQEGDSIAEQTDIILGRVAAAGVVYSSIPPLVPKFLHKLYLALPRHQGALADPDLLIKALLETKVPTEEDAKREAQAALEARAAAAAAAEKAAAERAAAAAAAAAAVAASTEAAAAAAGPGSDDERDDEDRGDGGAGHQRPAHDVFRQRQLAKLEGGV